LNNLSPLFAYLGGKMLKNAYATIGAKVADIIKKDDFWDEVENIVRMSQ